MPGRATSSPPPALAAPMTNLPHGWREWLWFSGWMSLALLAVVAAIVTEIASKRNASAARLAGQPGNLAYAAGWPFAYAHARLNGLTGGAWDSAIHGVPPAAAINWLVLVVDCVVLAVLFIMGIAVIVALWRVALRLRRRETMRAMRRAILTGITVTLVWAGISAAIITHINQVAPTDSAAQQAIVQMPTLVLLAPGAIGYAAQRWFESDAGANISLTGGLADGAEALAVLALAVVAPAALVTMLALVGGRVARARQQTEEQTAT